MYNGEKTLKKTLENIIDQYEEGLEIILSDDDSEDGTFDIVLEFSKNYDFVKAYKNEKNLGMDGNFLKSASLANGEYVWFFGQDDLMRQGTIKKVLTILDDKSIGIVYINYDQFDHDMKNILTKSYIDVYSKLDKDLVLDKDFCFKDSSEYFKYFYDLPSFLPATITRSKFWHCTDLSPFFGTNYIQVALMYLNMNKGSIYVITQPMIKGRIPDDKWQFDGRSHFNVLTGFLKMQKISLQNEYCKLPKEVYLKQRKEYLLNYFFFITLCKNRGLSLKKEQTDLLNFVFDDTKLLYLYILPVIFLPLPLLNFFNLILYPLKQLLIKAGFKKLINRNTHKK